MAKRKQPRTIRRPTTATPQVNKEILGAIRIDTAHASPTDDGTDIETIALARSTAKPPFQMTPLPESEGLPQATMPTESAEASDIATAADRLQKHADQLAGLLRERQKDLDHRQSQLNAGMAQLDRDARLARMWLAEREAELTNRAAELDQRERELQTRLNRLAASETAHRKAVAVEASGVETDPFKVETRPRPSGHGHESACLAEALAETERLRGELDTERKRLYDEVNAERDRLHAENMRESAEFNQKRQALARRADHIERCRKALKRMRADLGQMHRETLEVRLATEELWVQLSGAAPPAALTQSLGRIRSRLADQYRHASTELAAEKDELESIRRQLAEQCTKVVAQRKQFENWATARQREIDQQADRLVAREREIKDRDAELREQMQRWQAERLGLKREVQRLRRNPQLATVPV